MWKGRFPQRPFCFLGQRHRLAAGWQIGIWEGDGRAIFKEMARETGLEPAASAVTGRRSNQLSYSRGCCNP